jgi:hypothetical protein
MLRKEAYVDSISGLFRCIVFLNGFCPCVARSFQILNKNACNITHLSCDALTCFPSSDKRIHSPLFVTGRCSSVVVDCSSGVNAIFFAEILRPCGYE